MMHYVTPPTGIKLKYRGKFDLGRFYYYLKTVLEDNEFLQDEQTLEKEYVEKVVAAGKEIHIRWGAEKDANKYIKYKVEINFRILILEDRTDLEMKFIGWVESGSEDYDKLGWLSKIYFILIQKPKLDFHKTALYKKVYKFQEEAKKFLGVMNYE